MGADGLGGIVKEVCHRPDIWAKLAETDTGSIVTPDKEARVIRAEAIADTVYINKTDSIKETGPLSELARLIPCQTFMGSLRKRVIEKCH